MHALVGGVTRAQHGSRQRHLVARMQIADMRGVERKGERDAPRRSDI